MLAVKYFYLLQANSRFSEIKQLHTSRAHEVTQLREYMEFSVEKNECREVDFVETTHILERRSYLLTLFNKH